MLHTIYEAPIQGHAIRDWLSNHPKIVLPVLFTLLATVTYTVRKGIYRVRIISNVFADLRSNTFFYDTRQGGGVV